jgi:DNA-binding SARP family transcriptional activator
MSKLNHVTLRLFGPFAIAANAGRAIVIRSKKGRALLAYLAMKQDYCASREEIATLLWGDNPDALARHSLRQCLLSLRQDLSLAAGILIVDRETVGLSAEFISVDARTFMRLSQSKAPEGLAQATEHWRGTFLPDLALDIEEFESWRRQEASRLSSAAAVAFEALFRFATASGDGDAAIAAAERLIALDPTREDWQRNALKLLARHKGRETAMGHAKRLLDLLRVELGVAPEAATRAVIDAIKRGEFEDVNAPSREQPAAEITAQTTFGTETPAPLPPNVADASFLARPASATARLSGDKAPQSPSFWRQRPYAAVLTSIVVFRLSSLRSSESQLARNHGSL